MADGEHPPIIEASAANEWPSCTVVVPTRNRPEQLDACLAALSLVDYPSFEVLVVDNAPSDGRAKAIAARHGVGYLRDSRAGVARARNLGARMARNEIVVCLDDDSVVQTDWLKALAREFRDPSVDAVTGRIRALDEDTADERRFAGLSGAPLGGDQRLVFDRTMPDWFELANFGAVGNAANMAYRASLLERWPGFDERLGRGVRLGTGEENYAFFQIIELGSRIVYAPEAKVRHPFPRNSVEFRRRYLADQKLAVAYILFLFSEQPRYRTRLLRYLLEALSGKRRAWRVEPTEQVHRATPRWRAWLARMAGVTTFLQSRIA